jgi:PadR family transcriptional regulator, regulatory protein PadR
MDVLRMAILTALAGQRQHGYGLIREVEDLTDSSLRPAVGTLYRVLELLERDGLIAEDGGEVHDGRYRRYFRLTAAGHVQLVEAASTVESIATKARKRLALRAAEGAQ